MSKRAHEPGLLDGSEDFEKTEPAKKKQNTKGSNQSKGRKTPSAKAPKAKSLKTPEGTTKNKVLNKIIVSIDFGTTYSGISFIMKSGGEARNVLVVIEWPGAPGKLDRLEKVPSRIAFHFENDFKDDPERNRWGYEVEPGMKSYSWFKLLLDQGASQTMFDSATLARSMSKGLMELPAEMTAEDVVTAYLRELYSHAMSRLERKYTAGELNVVPIDFWFTVPATWEESAVGATRNAALAAGFARRPGDELYMITEPEAAAISSLSLAIENNPGLYKNMTTVLIVDCGGSTADLQTLSITSLSPLQTEETIAGIGAKCGAAAVDSAFCEWMESTFGDAYTGLPSSKIGPGSQLMVEFESLKKSFNGNDLNKNKHLPFPLLGKALQKRNVAPTSYDFEEFQILVTGHDIAAMFQPALDKTFQLVRQQLAALRKEKKALFKVICLCGGLGESEYVWKKFQEYIDDELQHECQLVHSDRPWSAVCRGGTIRGLEGSVVLSKKSKFWYGIGVHQSFQDGVDREEDGFFDALGRKRARGYVDWAVQKERKFTPNMRAYSRVGEAISVDWDDHRKRFTWVLYSCSNDEAPNRSDAPGVVEEGKIHIDLSKHYKKRKAKSGDAAKVEQAEVRLGIKLGNETGVLVVEAVHKDEVVGTARIDYARKQPRVPPPSEAGLL